MSFSSAPSSSKKKSYASHKDKMKPKPKLEKSKSLRYKLYARLRKQFLTRLSLQPLKDSFRTPTILLRRAVLSDVEQLSKLVTDHTKEVYGFFDLKYLVEMANCSLCQTTRKGDIVAFISTTGYPNVPSVPPMRWSPWVENLYGLDKCTSRNTAFLQMILWHDKYKCEFMEDFLKYLYMNNVMLQYIFVVTPPGVRPFHCLSPQLFKCILPKNTVGFMGDKLQKLYMNERKMLIPKFKIRRTVEEDNEDIMPQLDQIAPQLRKLYGDYLVSELLRYSDNKRLGLTGLMGENIRGFMLLNTDISYDTIQQYFDVAMYNGFRKKHKEDFRPKKTKQGIIVEVPMQIPDTIVNEDDEKSVKKSSLAKAEPELVAQPLPPDSESSEQTIRSEESSLNPEVYEYDKDEEAAAKTFQLPPIVSPGLFFQAQSSLNRINLRLSEGTTKDLLLAHALSKKSPKIAPHGAPPPISQNERNQEAVFCGDGNAVLIELFMLGVGIDSRLGYDFLETIFEFLPEVDYCLISIPTYEIIPPIMKHFIRVQPKVGMQFPHELYIIHRNAALGRIKVREAFPGDVMGVMELTSMMEKNRIIRDDFLQSITKKQSTLNSFVLLSENVVAGLCIISKAGYDTRLLESQFDIDQHMTPSLHPHHAFIKHTIISPIFMKLARLLFREIQRFSSVTCLYYTLYDEDMMKSDQIRMTTMNVLKHLIPIAPRQQLQYQAVNKLRNLSDITSEGEDYLAPIRILQEFEKGLPFALFLSTNRLATMTKNTIHNRIIVVGASETALSFLESLMFSTNEVYANVTLVSPHGLPFRQKPHAARDAMLVYTGRYNHRFLIQLGLHARLNIVYGYMTSIDRRKKHILIDYEKTLPYDFLFLFCGLQFTKPIPQREKHQHPGTQSSKYVQKYLDEYPSNMFLVRSEVDAGQTLITIQKLLPVLDTPNEDGRIIIYGHTLQALAAVSGLLLFGIPPKKIAFVESFPSQPTVTLFNNVEVDTAVLKSITNAGVELYTNCHFTRWELNKTEHYIKKIIFESVTKTIILDCICFFAFDFKSVDFRTFFSLVSAGLVFDGRLVIDKNFRTNDPFIYAAGSLTKYKRRYFAEHLNHEHYNSSEIGAKLFSIVRKKLDPNSAEYDLDFETDKEKEKRLEEERIAEETGDVDLPQFVKPKIKYCLLPGGWRYLHVTPPGIATPLECQLNDPRDNGPVYITGDCEKEDGPGYFRLAFNSVDKVCEITCYTKQEIEINNLVKLYDKHIALLNNICQRFSLGTVPDLFEYFRQPWTSAIYHDRFESVENKETELFYDESDEVYGPFVEVITDLLEKKNYSAISEDDKEFLRKKFNKTTIADGIQKTIKEYLVESKFQLPMYITDEYIIVQTELTKGRHLHSKPEVGITREYLLKLKELEEQKEEDWVEVMKKISQKEVVDERAFFDDSEDNEEWEDQLSEEEEVEEEGEEDEEGDEETRCHVTFEPKRQSISSLPKPPQDTGTMTENHGFCILSCMELHKDLTICKYCKKYLPEDYEKHLAEHRRGKREELEEVFSNLLYKPNNQPDECLDESISNETIEAHDYIDDFPDKISYKSYLSDREGSEKSLISQQSGKINKSLKSISIKSEMSSISATETGTIDIKEYSREALLGQNSEELRKLRIEEELKEKQEKQVFDKLSKSWLRYYN